jgi:hypothetical protein
MDTGLKAVKRGREKQDDGGAERIFHRGYLRLLPMQAPPCGASGWFSVGRFCPGRDAGEGPHASATVAPMQAKISLGRAREHRKLHDDCSRCSRAAKYCTSFASRGMRSNWAELRYRCTLRPYERPAGDPAADEPQCCGTGPPVPWRRAHPVARPAANFRALSARQEDVPGAGPHCSSSSRASTAWERRTPRETDTTTVAKATGKSRARCDSGLDQHPSLGTFSLPGLG